METGLFSQIKLDLFNIVFEGNQFGNIFVVIVVSCL